MTTEQNAAELQAQVDRADALLSEDLAETDAPQVARALLSKGGALVGLGRRREALDCFRDFLERFDDGTDTSDAVIWSLFQYGSLLQEAAQYEDSLAAFTAVLNRLGDSESDSLPYVVVEALWGAATNLWRLNRPSEALVLLRALATRYETDARPGTQIYVAQSMVTEAWLYGEANDNEQAITTLADVIGRFQESTVTDVQRKVVDAMVRMAALLSKLSRHAEAIQMAEDATGRFGHLDDPVIREDLATLNYHRAVDLIALGRDREGRDALSDLAADIGSDPRPRNRERMAMVLHAQARLMTQAGQFSELSPILVELCTRLSEEIEPRLRLLLEEAVLEAESGLVLGERWEDVVRAAEFFADWLDESSNEQDRGLAALLISDGVIALRRLRRSDDADALCQRLRFLGSDGLKLLDILMPVLWDEDHSQAALRAARVMFRRGVLLDQLGRTSEAQLELDRLVLRFKSTGASPAADVAAAAEKLRNRLRSNDS